MAGAASASAAGRIYGYVKGSDGRNLSSANIYCDVSYLGKSGSNGYYSFYVGAGAHRFTYGGITGYNNYVSPVINIYNNVSTRHDATLPAHKGLIFGSVKGSDGKFLAGADVWCDTTFLGKTDESGGYYFSVGAGTHRFTYGGVTGYENHVSDVIRIYPDANTMYNVTLNVGPDTIYNDFLYQSYKRRWYAGNYVAYHPNEAQSYVRANANSFSMYNNGSWWDLWPVDKMHVWLKLVDPQLQSYYVSGENTGKSTLDLATQSLYDIKEGPYHSYSIHRFWKGSLYYSVNLYDCITL